MRWTVIAYDDDDDVVQARVTNGVLEIAFTAAVAFEGRRAIFRGFHIQGAGGNTAGVSVLRHLAVWVKERLDVDELQIEGGLRTSGASPGRHPRPLVF